MNRRTFLKAVPAFTLLAATSSSFAPDAGKPAAPAPDLQPIVLAKPEKDGGKSVLAALWERRTIRTVSDKALSHNIIAGNDQDAVILGGSDCRVFNNIFFKNNAGGVFFFRRGCRNNTVVNNIIVELRPFRFDSAGSPAPGDQPQDNTIDHNCIVVGQRTIPLPAGAGPHNITAEPQFVDAARLDFRLKDNSPCIGTGEASVVEKSSGKPPDNGTTSAHPLGCPGGTRPRAQNNKMGNRSCGHRSDSFRRTAHAHRRCRSALATGLPAPVYLTPDSDRFS